MLRENILKLPPDETGMSRAHPGWVPERSIGHAWKACVPQGTEGSNPSPSAIFCNQRFINRQYKSRIFRQSWIAGFGAQIAGDTQPLPFGGYACVLSKDDVFSI